MLHQGWGFGWILFNLFIDVLFVHLFLYLLRTPHMQIRLNKFEYYWLVYFNYDVRVLRSDSNSNMLPVASESPQNS